MNIVAFLLALVAGFVFLLIALGVALSPSVGTWMLVVLSLAVILVTFPMGVVGTLRSRQ